MPCRCDYEPVEVNTKTYANEHIKACKAQSLAHKLALLLEENSVPVPHEIAKRVKELREDLLGHKRDEHNEDISKLTNQISKKENNIKQIRGLGGEPTKKLLNELEDLKREKSAILQVTDDELLGKAEY